MAQLDGVESARRSGLVRVLWRDDKGRSVKRNRPRRASISRVRSLRPSRNIRWTGDQCDRLDGSWRCVHCSQSRSAGRRRVALPLGAWRKDCLERCVAYAVDLSAANREAGGNSLPAGVGQDAGGKVRAICAADCQGSGAKSGPGRAAQTLTFYQAAAHADAAEPIPGPSTDYFGQLAKQHNLYIVAGLLERDQQLVYNVAVLLAPDGSVAGKYRKVCLPRGEWLGGVQPGHEYPVFDTRFGKLGMMVCYDGFFPEVARELTNHGAGGDCVSGVGLQSHVGRGSRAEPRLSCF